MNLNIIRHAPAVDEGSPGYESDSERPLTDKGRKNMLQIAQALRTQFGVEFDLILTTPMMSKLPMILIILVLFSSSL